MFNPYDAGLIGCMHLAKFLRGPGRDYRASFGTGFDSQLLKFATLLLLAIAIIFKADFRRYVNSVRMNDGCDVNEVWLGGCRRACSQLNPYQDSSFWYMYPWPRTLMKKRG